MTYLKIAKDYWISRNNILFIDHDDNLWFVGCNRQKKSGLNVLEPSFADPHCLNVRLSEGEKVTIFRSYLNDFYILTDHKRLIVFRSESGRTYGSSDENYVTGVSGAYSKAVDNREQFALLNQTFFVNSKLSPSLTPFAPEILRLPSVDSTTNPAYLFERSDNGENADPITSRLSTSSSKWRLLSWVEFMQLRGQARSDYISITTEKIANSIGERGSWTQSEEQLALAIRQIDSLEEEQDITQIQTEPAHYHYSGSQLSMHTNDSANRKAIYYNVNDIVFGPYCVIFKIGNQFIVDVLNLVNSPNQTVNRFKKLPLTKIRLAPNSYAICEACFPAHDECRFMKHFVYLKKIESTGSIHYLIFPTGGMDSAVNWIKFRDPFPEFDPEIIHWRRDDNLIYFMRDDKLWHHDNTNDLFIETSFESNQLIITRCHFNDYIYRTKYQGDLRYVYNYDFHSKSTTSTLIVKFEQHCSLADIKIYTLKASDNRLDPVYVVVCSSAPKNIQFIFSAEKVVILGPTEFECHDMVTDSIFAYTHQNIIHTIECFRGNSISSSPKMTCGKHPLPVRDEHILFLNLRNAAVIECHMQNYKYIYYAFSFDSFAFQQQLIADQPNIQISNSDDQVNEHLLFKTFTNSEKMALAITDMTDCLAKILEKIPGMISNNTYVPVEIYRESRNIALGRGVRHMFFTKAIREFADKYLTKHNHVTNFSENIKTLSSAELRNMGKLMAVALLNLQTHFEMRLPLVLVYAIKCKLPSRSNLEIIAKAEDPEAFTMLQEIRNDTLNLGALGLDYDAGLKSICKFDLAYEKIAAEIAHGFLFDFKLTDIAAMNFLTIDQYLSGKYSYDIERFLRQIRMLKVPDELQPLILDEIAHLTQAELATLLFNWSSKSIICENATYTIEVSPNIKSTISFATCYRLIAINADIVCKPYQDFVKTLKSLLVEECDKMSDAN